jgi:hypothetical protein
MVFLGNELHNTPMLRWFLFGRKMPFSCFMHLQADETISNLSFEWGNAKNGYVLAKMKNKPISGKGGER